MSYRTTPIPPPEPVTTQTPWGRADSRTRFGPGINSYSTPSHGGIKVAHGKNAKVHQAWRCADGWYEEDCDWAIVALTFPEFFTEAQVEAAHGCAARWHAEAYRVAWPHCADCRKPIIKGDMVTSISLLGEPTEHLHPACHRARCGYCSGRGWQRLTPDALTGPSCPKCRGTGRAALLARIDADTARRKAAGTACPKHPAFEADNCPGCGSAAKIGGAA